MKCLIWSVEHGAWWAPEKNGYVKSLIDAGTYELEEAIKICSDANMYTKDDEPPNETLVVL